MSSQIFVWKCITWEYVVTVELMLHDSEAKSFECVRWMSFLLHSPPFRIGVVTAAFNRNCGIHVLLLFWLFASFIRLCIDLEKWTRAKYYKWSTKYAETIYRLHNSHANFFRSTQCMRQIERATADFLFAVHISIHLIRHSVYKCKYLLVRACGVEKHTYIGHDFDTLVLVWTGIRWGAILDILRMIIFQKTFSC